MEDPRADATSRARLDLQTFASEFEQLHSSNNANRLKLEQARYIARQRENHCTALEGENERLRRELASVKSEVAARLNTALQHFTAIDDLETLGAERDRLVECVAQRDHDLEALRSELNGQRIEHRNALVESSKTAESHETEVRILKGKLTEATQTCHSLQTQLRQAEAHRNAPSGRAHKGAPEALWKQKLMSLRTEKFHLESENAELKQQVAQLESFRPRSRATNKRTKVQFR